MVLIKLRLNVPSRDLAYRFGVSVPTVARTFLSWMTIMDIGLSPLMIGTRGIMANYAPMLGVFFWKEDNSDHRLF